MRKNIISTKNIRILMLLLFAISFAFILSGCNSSYVSTKLQHYIGYDGLVLTFFKSNPVQVYEGDEFIASAVLQNNGAYSVGNLSPGILSVNYDDYYLTLKDSERKQNIILGGKSDYNPSGDMDYYQFEFQAKYFTDLRDSVKTTINYNMCYPYRTAASTVMCIDTKSYAPDQGPAACTAQEYSDSGGQGAPLAVTRIVPNMLAVNKDSVRPQFQIYIANKGNGYVINNFNESPDVCVNPSLNSQNLNKISVKAYLSNKTLTCQPSVLQLVPDSDNIVRCFVNDNDTSDYNKIQKNYVAPLTIILNYGYMEVDTQDLQINRAFEFTQANPNCKYFEKEVNGTCISLCEYCANPANSLASECKNNFPTTTFSFDQNFGCNCGKSNCIALTKTGDCIFGYCRDNYCCRITECNGKPDGTPCSNDRKCQNQICGGNPPAPYAPSPVTPQEKDRNQVELTKNRLIGLTLPDGTTVYDYMIQDADKNGIPKPVFFGLETQEGSGINHNIRIGNPDTSKNNYAIGLFQIEGKTWHETISHICGNNYVSECNGDYTNCHYNTFHDDMKCQVDVAAYILRDAYNNNQDDAKYASRTAPNYLCKNTGYQQRYASYTGWDRALRAYNGFGCLEFPAGDPNYVEKVNKWAFYWSQIFSPPV